MMLRPADAMTLSRDELSEIVEDPNADTASSGAAFDELLRRRMLDAIHEERARHHGRLPDPRSGSDAGER
jgi:hypothetical protein